MALSSSIYGKVGTPRVYVDYIQYARAIGYVFEYSRHNINGDIPLALDLNPANINDYIISDDDDSGSVGAAGFGVRFKNHDDIDNNQFSLFLNTVNYFGILGHKISTETTVGSNGVGVNIYNNVPQMQSADYNNSSASSIVGNITDPGVGYNLYSIDTPFSLGFASEFKFYVYNNFSDVSGDWSANDTIRIGSFTIGRYFDFPFSPDLNVKMNTSYDGIKRNRTVGGSDITNITYYKAPQWGDLPAWQHIETDDYDDPNDVFAYENYSQVSSNGRRAWQIKFSYIDKTDMFPKSFDGNLVGEYLSALGSFDNPVIGAKIKDNFLNSFLALSLGGSLKFIFQPDKTKKDFCMCVLDQSGASITQSSPGMYDVSLTFVETW